MARPLSEEKRDAILAAATDAVAALGTGAPTAKIAKAAGVAEGTLFTYFPTKDDLLNALYLQLKSDLHGAMMATYPASGDLRARCRHVWDRFIDWGVDHAAKSKAMRQLTVSDRICEASRQSGNAAFRDAETLLKDVMAMGALSDQSIAFVGAVMQSLAETTVQFIEQDPEARDRYKRAGFDAFWSALTKP